MEEPRQPQTFIVRLTLGDRGALSGVVERVRTGEKQRFVSAAALVELIAEMADRDTQTLRQTKRRR